MLIRESNGFNNHIKNTTSSLAGVIVKMLKYKNLVTNEYLIKFEEKTLYTSYE